MGYKHLISAFSIFGLSTGVVLVLETSTEERNVLFWFYIWRNDALISGNYHMQLKWKLSYAKNERPIVLKWLIAFKTADLYTYVIWKTVGVNCSTCLLYTKAFGLQKN